MADLTIRINGFNRHSVRNAITKLKKYQTTSNQQVNEACMKVADFGSKWAQSLFDSVGKGNYDGNYDVTVTAEPTQDGARVVASGETVLFIEYGAGVHRGYGHPDPQGYGPGTYPGKGHWNDPNGWWYRHGERTLGNPPSAAMYYAEQAMRRELDNIVRGTLST